MSSRKKPGNRVETRVICPPPSRVGFMAVKVALACGQNAISSATIHEQVY
jgi:hypothetical protein